MALPDLLPDIVYREEVQHEMSQTPVAPQKQRIAKPKWLRVKLPTGDSYKKVRSLVDQHKLHTICELATAPTWANAGAQVRLPL